MDQTPQKRYNRIIMIKLIPSQNTESGVLREIDDFKLVGRMKYYPFEYFKGFLDKEVRNENHVIITTITSADVLFAESFSNTGDGCKICGICRVSFFLFF